MTEPSGSDPQDEDDVPCPIAYGRNYTDADLWLDRDGAIYRGAGPFVGLPSRRLRRALTRWFR